MKWVINAQYPEPVGWGAGEVVGRGVSKGVGLEAEGAADTAGATVAGGENVDVGVADHDGFSGGDGVAGDSARFRDQTLKAVRVGLLCVEAVASVVLEKEL